MRFVMDACTAILLGKATVLEVTFEVYDVHLPLQVYEEVLEGKKTMLSDAFLLERLVTEKKAALLEADAAIMRKLAQDFNMGEGEASTLALALQNKECMITDNNQGRKAAKVNNIQLVGSIEIIVDLFRKDKISLTKAKGAFEVLRNEGWFDNYLIDQALEDLKHERG